MPTETALPLPERRTTFLRGQPNEWPAADLNRAMLAEAALPLDAPPGRRTTFLQGRRIAFAVAVLNIMNAIMGAAILALPYWMAQNGVVLYLVLQLGVMIAVDLSLQMLVSSSREQRVFTYEGLGKAAFGRPGKVLVCIAIMVQNVGAIVSYLVVLADLGCSSLHSFPSRHTPTPTPPPWRQARERAWCARRTRVRPCDLRTAPHPHPHSCPATQARPRARVFRPRGRSLALRSALGPRGAALGRGHIPAILPSFYRRDGLRQPRLLRRHGAAQVQYSIHICIYIYIDTVPVCIRIFVYIYTVHACICVYLYVYMYVYVYVYRCIHFTCMHIHAYICLHVCIACSHLLSKVEVMTQLRNLSSREDCPHPTLNCLFPSLSSFSVMVTLKFGSHSCAASIGDAALAGRHPPCEDLVLATFGRHTVTALPTLCFSFVCHTAFLPVLSELRQADLLARSVRQPPTHSSQPTIHVYIYIYVYNIRNYSFITHIVSTRTSSMNQSAGSSLSSCS